MIISSSFGERIRGFDKVRNVWFGNANSQSLNQLGDLFLENQGDQAAISKANLYKYKENVLPLILEWNAIADLWHFEKFVYEH